jgi:hypothetical protein
MIKDTDPKCLAKGTPILMYNGSIKLVENIKVGDKLMGDDSTPRLVKSLARGKEMMYDIIPLQGNKYTVNESHILSLMNTNLQPIIINNKVVKHNQIIDISVNDYIKTEYHHQGMNSPLKGYRVPIEFKPKRYLIEPYTFGQWLINNNLDKSLKLKMKIMNPYNNKIILDVYKLNIRDVRLKVLAGIIDTYGSLTIKLNNETLIDDIIFVSRSLGLSAYKKKTKDNSYLTSIIGRTKILPLKRRSLYGKQINDVSTYSINIQPVGFDNYYGFEIDKNRRFLLADFTVTHNTVLGIYLACQLKVKSLVIVHKTFLQNQWYERIKQFTNAKIGMIRQRKIDVKGKDIIIGMLQSISMIEYDPTIFNDIQLVIVDECFVHDTGIITHKGIFTINQLYDMWTDNKELPLIKSYNHKTELFEYKQMTYAWRKTTKQLLKIKFHNITLTCTPNHKIYTDNGYRYAKDLRLNDNVIGINNSNNKITTFKVMEVIYDVPIINEYKYVYDIEVHDNHNFIVCNNNQNGVVVHNCHHISSRVFSKALLKVGAKYTIGLSATPYRADGLSKVFFWYLGDMLYRIERKGDKNVVVKIFNYESNDKLFVEKKTWCKGKVRVSIPKMVTNLCKIEGRNKLLIDMISNLRTHEGRKVLIF